MPGPPNQLTRTLTGTGTYDSNPDSLQTLLLQKDEKTYLYFISRQVAISDREPCNTNSSKTAQTLANPTKCSITPSIQNLTLNLPPSVESASIVQPTAGGSTTPTDGVKFTPLQSPITNPPSKFRVRQK